ncbi:MAG: restriction endonuclease subunit S [Candidatus Gastranaerophilales bacterium]|nr:restriction endonuclease subunit S [Candidatus Gastranaerophilales bacterium]
MEYKQLKDIADIQTGLVLSRKGAKQLELIPQEVSEQISLLKPIEYKVISLRSIDSFGNINLSEVDDFQSIEDLPEKYLTQENDIVLRLFTPVYSCIIKKEQLNMVIPSQCAVIRVNRNYILPDFIQLYLMKGDIEQQLANKEVSTQLRSVRTSSIGEIQIPVFPMEKQEKIIATSKLLLKKEQLLNLLSEQQSLYNKAIIKSLIQNKMEI